jgi:hypothetical protein
MKRSPSPPVSSLHCSMVTWKKMVGLYIVIIIPHCSDVGARGSVVRWGNMLQARRSRVWFPMRPLDFSIPASGRTMALGSTEPQTVMNIRIPPRNKGWPARKSDLTAICESIVEKMWEPRSPTTLWASKACYRDSYTFYSSNVRNEGVKCRKHIFM